MVDLALHEQDGPVQRQRIVARQDISSHYLAHLFVKLRQAGLVASVMGPGGGYRLARSAADITAGDVLRAVEERLEPVFCLEPTPETACPRADICATRHLWARLGEHVMDLLDSVTLAELCTQARDLAGEERSRVEHAGAKASGRRPERRRRQFSSGVFIDGAGI